MRTLLCDSTQKFQHKEKHEIEQFQCILLKNDYINDFFYSSVLVSRDTEPT